VPPFIVKDAVPLLIPTRIAVPTAAVGELMIGPEDIAISTVVLMVGRVLGFQFIASDQRLFPLPLSQETAKTLVVKNNKTANINTGTVLRIDYLNGFHFIISRYINDDNRTLLCFSLLPPLFFERHFSLLITAIFQY
jgi:hypothetical protein